MSPRQIEQRARARGVSVEEHRAAVQSAIDAFNFNPAWDDFYGHKVAHQARFPILAEDCDYEISRVSGVEGRRISA
jgi:hypothetical protein